MHPVALFCSKHMTVCGFLNEALTTFTESVDDLNAIGDGVGIIQCGSSNIVINSVEDMENLSSLPYIQGCITSSKVVDLQFCQPEPARARYTQSPRSPRGARSPRNTRSGQPLCPKTSPKAHSPRSNGDNSERASFLVSLQQYTGGNEDARELYHIGRAVT